jgi:hypothetical protein
MYLYVQTAIIHVRLVLQVQLQPIVLLAIQRNIELLMEAEDVNVLIHILTLEVSCVVHAMLAV